MQKQHNTRYRDAFNVCVYLLAQHAGYKSPHLTEVVGKAETGLQQTSLSPDLSETFYCQNVQMKNGSIYTLVT